MRGKGIREPTTGRFGHQYLHFNVAIPKHLTDKQTQLMKEFGDIEESKSQSSK